MGHMNALGFAEAVENGEVDLTAALTYHLTANHYPPVPTSMVSVCIDAIDAINEGYPDEDIPLPEGVTFRGRTVAPAYEIASQHHLEAFLDA